MCVIIKQISSTQLLVGVCVCVCNRSAPGSAIKEAPRYVCVFLYTRKNKGSVCVYVCHHHSPVDSFFYSTSRSASITHTDTRSCVLEICLMMTHTHSCPRLIGYTNTYFYFTFTGAFPLHTCGVTRSWRIYFTSVRLVFLVETVVLQTVATVRYLGMDRPFSR